MGEYEVAGMMSRCYGDATQCVYQGHGASHRYSVILLQNDVVDFLYQNHRSMPG